MEMAKGIMELVYVGIGIVATGIPLIITLVMLFKGKTKEQVWNTIMTMADAAIAEAEKSGKSGADKKQMVIDAVTAACTSQGINVGPFVNQLASYIDQCIAFVNKVNN